MQNGIDSTYEDKIHELMILWARETYSNNNLGKQRETYSVCLQELRRLVHCQRSYGAKDATGKFFEFQDLVEKWKYDLIRIPDEETRFAYSFCIEQLQGIIDVARFDVMDQSRYV